MFKNKLKLEKNKKSKIALCLSGGGTRGFVHLGVIKALQEYGLNFDYIVGTSAGSLVGAFLAAGMTYEEIYNIAESLEMKDIKTNIIPFKSSKTDGLQKILIDNLGDIDIQELKTPFCAVCTDLKTTKECVVTKGSLAKAVAGSCCLPYVFYPVEFEDKLFVDGGLHNTIPADIPKLLGCDYVIAVDVNKSRTYGTDSSKLLEVLTCSFRILMDKNIRKGYQYADYIIKPETKKFKALKKEGVMDMIEEGYKETIDKMPEILEIFNKKPLSKRQKNKFKTEYSEIERELIII